MFCSLKSVVEPTALVTSQKLFEDGRSIRNCFYNVQITEEYIKYIKGLLLVT